ncbi:MAG TPA: hypothetical protein VK524_11875, partial [Polyangiaceae bacterium]|nr:hypothetical protein [Polyangiaceae bacterium]
HLEWSPVDNLARYGWDRFVDHAHSNAEGLAWPLHAIGDVAEPHHVVGTTSWGHRPYEEIVDHNEATFFPDGAARAAQLRQIVTEGFRWWKQFRSGENMQKLVEDLAAQTRKKVKDADDWAYQDGPSVRWQFDNAGGEEVYDRKDDEMRALLVDGAAATLAVLTVASTKVPDVPRGDIDCPQGSSYAPGLGCVPGPPPVRPQPIDLSEAGISLVATADAGGGCTPDVVLDGATMALIGTRFDVTAPTPNDSCPNMFWVEIRNPRQLFTRGGLTLGAAIDVSPLNEPTCERSFALHAAHVAASGLVEDPVVPGTGAFASCTPDQTLCFNQCSGLPQLSFTPNTLPSEVAVRFGTPVQPNTVLAIAVSRPIEPPH